MRTLRVKWLFSEDRDQARKGAFLILAAFCLILTIGFVAFSVDLGLVSLTRSRMQSAVDSAALAAAMEITHAVESAPADEEDITGYCRDAAAAKAVEVAQMNGFFVDPDADVIFGHRVFNESSQQFVINWSLGPYDSANVVKVIARRENADLSRPDGKLRLFFAGIFGDNTATLRAEASAFVEARDIVVVHDFSRSMNFDSYFTDETVNTPPDEVVEDNLLQVWMDLQPINTGGLVFDPRWLTMSRNNPNINLTFRNHEVDVTTGDSMASVYLVFTDGRTQTLSASGTSGTFKGSGSNNGKNISRVDVTVRIPSQEPKSASVSQSGSPTINFDFTGDRQSVSASASSNWNRVELTFTNGSSQTFSVTARSGTYAGTGSNSGRQISQIRMRYSSSWRAWVSSPPVTYETVYNNSTYRFDDTNSAVMSCFGLNGVSYPFPSGSWDDYINFVRSNAKLAEKGYQERFGGLTFVNYVLKNRSAYSQTPQLANTKHYPFHAIKMGHTLLCTFLENLGFNDYVGMVSYDTYHRVETTQSGPNIPAVDITAEPLGTNYEAVKQLMISKQANHYYASTNIGGGMRKAVGLLADYGRSGARPNIILMTDGNANVTDGPTNLPSGWTSWFNGYDGNGTSYDINYDSPSNSVRNARLSLLYEVHQAVQNGYRIHTIAVGSDADWRTMKAISHYAQGEFIYVPGGTTAEVMEENLMAAFHKIAGLVPPAKLVNPNAP